MKKCLKYFIFIAFFYIDISISTVNAETVLPCTISNNLTLTKQDSPYLVTCNIKVQPNVQLIINEDVKIIFYGFYNFEIYGEIQAKGTEFAPVIFQPSGNIKTWRNFYMKSPTGKCEFSHVTFKNGIIKALDGNYNFDNIKIFIDDTTIIDDALYAEDAIIQVRNSYIEANNISEGIIVFTSLRPIIENCVAINTADSYQFVQCTDGIISNNISINSSDDGIDQNGCINTAISGNTIIKPKDKGITISHDGWGSSLNITLEKNIIINAPTGLELKSGSTVIVKNNTLYNCNVGIHCYEKVANSGGAIVKVLNTIIYGSTTNLLIDEKSEIQINYSLSNNDQLAGVGNLMDDPYFLDTLNNNFNLLQKSPCINTGDPDSPLDPDGTRADIGALYFNNVPLKLVINEINYNSSEEFDSGDWIELFNTDSNDIDISKWTLTVDDNSYYFEFPGETFIQKNNYIVLSNDSFKLKAIFTGAIDIIEDNNFELSNSGDLIKLYNKSGLLIDSVNFGITEPWAEEANGQGASLELINPKLDNSLPASWSASLLHGTPGLENSILNNQKEDSFDNNLTISSIYPNPAMNYIFVSFENNFINNPSIKLFDYAGNSQNCVYSISSINEKECLLILDTKKLLNGKYYLKIEENHKSVIANFVILK